MSDDGSDASDELTVEPADLGDPGRTTFGKSSKADVDESDD